MKMKRFRIFRPEIKVEFVRPILGRIRFIISAPGFLKLATCQFVINTPDGQKPLKKIYILAFPKFEFSDARKE